MAWPSSARPHGLAARGVRAAAGLAARGVRAAAGFVVRGVARRRPAEQRAEHPFRVEQQDELIVDRRDLVPEALLGARDGCRVDPSARNPLDSLDVVDDQPERSIAELEHDDLGILAGMRPMAEPVREVGDRHHRPAEVDHSADEPARGGARRRARVADDFTDGLDRHRELLAVQGENDELSLGITPSVLARGHIGV